MIRFFSKLVGEEGTGIPGINPPEAERVCFLNILSAVK